MRIFTDINISKEHEKYRRKAGFASLDFGKIGCLRRAAIAALLCG
jgi:hypothetical protein